MGHRGCKMAIPCHQIIGGKHLVNIRKRNRKKDVGETLPVCPLDVPFHGLPPLVCCILGLWGSPQGMHFADFPVATQTSSTQDAGQQTHLPRRCPQLLLRPLADINLQFRGCGLAGRCPLRVSTLNGWGDRHAPDEKRTHTAASGAASNSRPRLGCAVSSLTAIDWKRARLGVTRRWSGLA